MAAYARLAACPPPRPAPFELSSLIRPTGERDRAWVRVCQAIKSAVAKRTVH